MLLRMTNISDKSCSKNLKKIRSIDSFSSENSAIYDIMCKKYGTATQATDDNIIRRMPIVCCITKTTDTH